MLGLLNFGQPIEPQEEHMAQIIPLESVVLTEQVKDAWLALAAQAVDRLAGVDPQDIPDEQARIEEDGTLTIFVEVPNILSLSLSVPAGEWVYTH